MTGPGGNPRNNLPEGGGPPTSARLNDQVAESGTDSLDLVPGHVEATFLRLDRDENVLRTRIRGGEGCQAEPREPPRPRERSKYPPDDAHSEPPGTVRQPNQCCPNQGERGGRRRPGFSNSGVSEVDWDTALQSTFLTAVCPHRHSKQGRGRPNSRGLRHTTCTACLCPRQNLWHTKYCFNHL